MIFRISFLCFASVLLPLAVIATAPPPPPDLTDLSPLATPETQSANVTQGSSSSSVTLSGHTVGAAVDALNQSTQTKGLQFKHPFLTSGLTYTAVNDGTFGGFGGNEISGDIAVDADVFDGWIAGLMYQRVYRGATNEQGTSEHLHANGVSLYVAKRFFDFVNTGLSFNYVNSEHRLTRQTLANLDNESFGGTGFIGISRRSDQFSYAGTLSLTYAASDYSQQQDPDFLLMGLTGSLGYDLAKEWSLFGIIGYNHFIEQGSINNIPARDDDYFTIGPRLVYYPNDDLTLTLDFTSQEGYAGYSAYTLRMQASLGY